MSEINEANSNFKLSRVDLEVEKLKLQSDLELAGNIVKDDTELSHGIDLLDLESMNAECIYDYNSKEELYEKIVENWDKLTGADCFEFIATLQELKDDELILNLFKKYNGYKDPELLALIVASLNDKNIRQEYIKEINDICMSADYKNSFDVTDMMSAAKKNGLTNYTAEYCQKLLSDRFISHIVATLENPDTMMEYYKEMDDIYAKETVLNGIQKLPVYSSELTTEELQEVSARMKEEVSKAEALNVQTRAGLEEEIMASLRSLTKAKQEYARLTKETSKEDSLDLE